MWPKHLIRRRRRRSGVLKCLNVQASCKPRTYSIHWQRRERNQTCTNSHPNWDKELSILAKMAQPTAFIHSFLHYEIKLRRSAYDATNNNPKSNEAPYYEVWDLWINDFIINQQDYSLRPQGLLSLDISTGRKAKTLS